MRQLNENHVVYFSGPDELAEVLADLASTLSKETDADSVESLNFERYVEEDGRVSWTASVVTYGKLSS
jgi:hypothetical protein